MSTLEKLDITEELKSVKLISFVILSMILIMSIVEKTMNKNLISLFTIFELILLVGVFRGYVTSLNKYNYGFWGFSFVILLILLRNLFHFTFFEISPVLIYMSIFSLMLFCINSYVMSSPIYYPRVQWWEYDYKFRADLKIQIQSADKKYQGRLTDLRRSEASLEMFESIPLESTGLLMVGDKIEVAFQIKSIKSIIPGRPLRYGIKLYKKDKDFQELKAVWATNKKVKLRTKFSE